MALVEIPVLLLCLVCLLMTGHISVEPVVKLQFGLGIIFLFPCVVLGYTLAARKVPIQVMRYGSVDGTVDVRFASAAFAEKFVAGIQAWEKKIQ